MNDRPSLITMVLAQTRVEMLLAVRRGESVLVTLVIPPLLLLFFGSVRVLPDWAADRPVDFLLPGVLALAIMSTGMVSLGIATAFERYYRVLKRLGATPLPRAGLLLAKLAAVVLVEVVQVALLLAIAVIQFGWRPNGGAGLALAGLALVLGTAAFAGLGLWMAGTLRAEATLAIANGLYVVFVLLGGIVFPLDVLPPALAWPAGLLPATALGDMLRGALVAGPPTPWGSLAVLTAWAIATPLAAALTFRWE